MVVDNFLISLLHCTTLGITIGVVKAKAAATKNKNPPTTKQNKTPVTLARTGVFTYPTPINHI